MVELLWLGPSSFEHIAQKSRHFFFAKLPTQCCIQIDVVTHTQVFKVIPTRDFRKALLDIPFQSREVKLSLKKWQWMKAIKAKKNYNLIYQFDDYLQHKVLNKFSPNNHLTQSEQIYKQEGGLEIDTHK